jgi:hypothetical protein
MKKNGFVPIIIVLIVVILGLMGYLVYKSKMASINTNQLSPSQNEVKQYCGTGYCVDYDNSQIMAEKGFTSDDVEIVIFDGRDGRKYTNETHLMSLRIVSSENKNIDEYIKANQDYCDGLTKEGIALAGDCHRFTEVGRTMISGSNFVEVYESGGGGSTASLDYLIMNNGKVYEFGCDPLSKDEFELLDPFDLQKISLFEKTESFKMCTQLVEGFKFTQ